MMLAPALALIALVMLGTVVEIARWREGRS
jgi:hypothetical protein